MAKGLSRGIRSARAIICHRNPHIQARVINMIPGLPLAAMGFRLINTTTMILASMGSLVMDTTMWSIVLKLFIRTVHKVLSCTSFSSLLCTRVSHTSIVSMLPHKSRVAAVATTTQQVTIIFLGKHTSRPTTNESNLNQFNSMGLLVLLIM